jgi:hypothetical protein
MANLKPFRDYNEHDVINMFAFDGAPDANGVIATKGTVVKIASANGVQPVSTSALGSEVVELDLPAGNTYNNTVSYRYSAVPKVAKATYTDVPLGITLYDVRELDENGEKLSYNPRKAAEMNVVVSGQAVPVLTKGILLYEGLNTTLIPTSASAGDTLYVHSTAGELSTLDAGSAPKVGKLLGKPVSVNGKGVALIQVQF